MIRITINWTFTSPALKIAIGTLLIEDIQQSPAYQIIELIKCKVKKENYTLSFEEIETSKYNIFEELRDKIETMVQSYYFGMMLESRDFSWIDDSADISFDGWIRKRRLDKKQERT
ncbi:MAG: hypothetical protein ACFFG0_00535 [Candidatus Thorarchaeota archaeon]